jgi:uncharacterized integral membrane protein
MAKKTTTTSTTRAARSAAKPAARTTVTEVEVVEEKAGATWEAGVAILTALLLIVAILMVDYELGTSYGGGVFFK